MKHCNERHKSGSGFVFATIPFWIAALLFAPLLAQAEQKAPAELASFTAIDMNSDKHEPALDSYGISGRAQVYGSFSNQKIPDAIRGYNRVDAANIADLKPGQWTVVKPNSYDYVVIYPLPEELTAYINDAEITVKIWHGWAAYRAEASGLWDSSNMRVAGSWADRLNPLGADIVVVGFNKTPVIAPPAEISAYGGAALNGNSAASNGAALAAESGAGRWLWVTTTANSLFIITRVAPEAPTELVDVQIWAPVATKFAGRNAITLEVGASVNLTAVLKARGTLKSDDRDVVWSFTPSPAVEATDFTPTMFPTGILPDGTFVGKGLLRITAKAVGVFEARVTSSYTLLSAGGNNTDLIKITVVPATVFDKSPINVVDGGVSGWTDGVAKPPFGKGITYLGFTADVHNGLNSFSADTRSIFKSWMDNLKGILGGKTLEYMSFLGDQGSAYQSGKAYWDSTAVLMGWADEYAASGFVGKNIFTFGNHEWYTSAGGNYRDKELQKHPAAKRLARSGEGIVKTSKYILYPFGPVEHEDKSAEYGSPMIFELPEIEKLANYLATAPKNIPIFVMSHFPIHTYLTAPPFRVEDRFSVNAELLLETLNKYPNVIFLWGHNHSSVDPLYDKVIKPGDMLLIGYGDLGETRRINFFYAGAGTMSDREYRPDLGPYQIEGKGLLAAIDGAKITFIWYERPAEPPTPEFKMPSGLESLVAAAGGGDNMKVWYDYYNYRLDAPSSRGTWSSGWYLGALTASPYSGAGGLLSLGNELVIIGFKGKAALATADDIAALAIKGYDPRITSTDGIPASLVPGSWHVATNPDRTMIFVLLRTVTDGKIRLPGTFGRSGIKVLDVVEPRKRNPSDAPYGWIKVDGNGFTWREIMDVLTASGTPELFLNGKPVSNTDVPYNDDPGYSLKIGGAYYGVVTPSTRTENPSNVYD